MAVTDQQIDEFIKKIEEECAENEKKIAIVEGYLKDHPYEQSASVTNEAKKLIDEAERQATYESNQRVAQLNDEISKPNSTSGATFHRRRGMML